MTYASEERLMFPAYYGEAVAALIRDRGGDLGLLRRQVGLSVEKMLQPGVQLTQVQFKALMSLGLQHTVKGVPRVLQFLRHLPITAHALVGVAAMTAETLDEALDVTLHYFPLLMPALELHRETVGNEAHIYMRRLCDLGPELNALLMELMVASFGRMAHYASGSAGKQRTFSLEVHFTHAANDEADALAEHFGRPVNFGGPENKFVITRSVLNLPLLTRNRSTHQALEALLERQLQALAQPSQLSQRVRRLLVEALGRGHLPGAEAVAEQLALSVRTMSRRLREEQTSFQALIEAVRIERAEVLLMGSDMPLAKVAQQLGFNDISAFSRAFKRVRGQPPSELRRHGRGA